MKYARQYWWIALWTQAQQLPCPVGITGVGTKNKEMKRSWNNSRPVLRVPVHACVIDWALLFARVISRTHFMPRSTRTSSPCRDSLCALVPCSVWHFYHQLFHKGVASTICSDVFPIPTTLDIFLRQTSTILLCLHLTWPPTHERICSLFAETKRRQIVLRIRRHVRNICDTRV